jgi:phosphoribosylanthranilate isomerase
MSVKVKICGMTSLEDAEHAAELGAWAIGLIHHEPSPRFVAPDVAEQIGAALRRKVEIAGVFVNAPLDDVVDAAEREHLSIVQLHGDEGPSFCTEAARRTGAKVMKAFRVETGADITGAEAYRTDYHLFDAHLAGTPGGTGEIFDWQLLARRRSRIPMVLAGGLDPGNVAEAIEVVKPFAVDVVSGVEAEPGRKDPALVEAFLRAVGTPAGEAEEVAG